MFLDLVCLFSIILNGVCWIVWRLQGYNVQKPLPRQHMRTIPALGMLSVMCHKPGGASSWGADSSGSRAWPTVRRICPRVSSPVQSERRAVGKSSAVYSEASATPSAAVSSCFVSQLPRVCVCVVALWQSWSLFVVVYIMFWKLSSILLRLLTFCAASQRHSLHM